MASTSTSTTLPLAGKIALITGGSKGIGAALSHRLASLGATIAINYSSDSTSANTLLSQLPNPTSPSPPHTAIQADASTLDGIQYLISTVVATYSHIDILIACAGILHTHTLASTTPAAFDASFALNVKGPYFLSQAAVPHMPRGSRIVLFSTTQCAASTVTPGYLLYNATKGAVEQMTRVMAKELAPRGITVNCAAPGPTGTDLFFKGKTPQTLEAIAKMNPQGRIGEPQEVADAVSLLVREEGRWMTGQVVRINGGVA